MTITGLNQLNEEQLRTELGKCCGSHTWVNKMLDYFPMEDVQALVIAGEKAWYACEEKDWLEAFGHHARIGDMGAPELLGELAEAGRNYEEKFGFVFIACATGMSAMDMLTLLKSRLMNAPGAEINIAMMEQNKITKLRLEKLIS